jgi:hypothetical protein
VKLVISGDSGGEWYLLREPDGWSLYSAVDAPPTSTMRLDAETAWRLFTKGIPPEEAQKRAMIEGNPALAHTLFDIVSIIA